MIAFTDVLILAVVALTVWAGHWFPWHISRDLVDDQGNLKRVPAYIYGTTCMLLGMAAWSYTNDHWPAFFFLCLVAVAAGIGTTLPRLFRREVEFQARGQDQEDRHD